MYEITPEYSEAFKNYFDNKMYGLSYSYSYSLRKFKKLKIVKFRHIKQNHIDYFKKIMDNFKTKNLTIA